MTLQDLYDDVIDPMIKQHGRQLADCSGRLRRVTDQRASQLLDAHLLLHATDSFIDLAARVQAHERERAAAKQQQWLYLRGLGIPTGWIGG